MLIRIGHVGRTTLAGLSALALMIAVAPAQGQIATGQATGASETQGGLEEIVVTARKREESIMTTPVIVQAISSTEVQNLKIQSFNDLASVTPGLQVATAFGTVGTYVYLRGLGNGGAANFGDQDVQLNVDNASLSHGAFYRAGMFDVGQIEILAGPQALFFGKSSSAGIIAIHSADPTAQWESKLTSGYEFNAAETDFDGYVSGPITDSLGIRVAGFHNLQKGWMTEDNPTNYRRIPNEEDDGLRLTLKYDGSNLRAKLKAAHFSTYSNMWSGDLGQRICYGPRPVNVGYAYDNCRADTQTQSGPLIGAPNGILGQSNILPYNPNVDWFHSSLGDAQAFATGTFDPLYKSGQNYTYTHTDQAVLNIDYDIVPGLTLTSVTSFSYLDTVDTGAAWTPLSATSSLLFDLSGELQEQNFSEEIRLTSNWTDRWFNFMVGGLYTPSTITNHTGVEFPAFTVAYVTDDKIETDVYSGFGQLLLTPIPHWELSAGLRYSSFKKKLKQLTYTSNLSAFQPVGTTGDVLPYLPSNLLEHDETNTSPEVTVTWRPNSDITAFASYKRGYKGPGININEFTGQYVPGQVGYYNGEKVKGAEVGVKAVLMDRHLNLTATGYSYLYDNLQVAFYTGKNFTTTVANGADARVEGFELSAAFNPPRLEDLSLRATVDWNHSYYTSFYGAPCYAGQEFSAGGGCNNVDPAIGYTSGTQNLTGQTLAHAPKWTGIVGADYKLKVTDDYSASFSLNANFSSSYQSVDQGNPLGLQGSYATLDTALRFGRLDGPWEVGFIVRNLTNRYITAVGADDGNTFGTPGDILSYLYRTRQYLLQATVRPALFK
jgi:iron complex outermembrane receptor protein